MGQEDTALSALEVRMAERKAVAAERKAKEDLRKAESKTVDFTTLQSDSDRNDTNESEHCSDYEPSTPKMQKISAGEVSCSSASKATLQQFVVHLTDSKHQAEPDQWYCQFLHTA